jgi:hypothetical protein
MKLRGMCMIVSSIAIVFLIAHEVHSADYSCTNCFDHVSRGGDHSCAVREDGSVTCWGDDDNGQSTPPSLADNWNFVQVSSGGFHTCAVVKCTPAPPLLCPIGNVRCWGRDSHGQASPGFTGLFSQVSAGLNHTCGVTGGSIDCWGDDSYGQSSPSSPPFGHEFIQVSAGGFHACAVSECTTPPCLQTANVRCWGDPEDGRTTVPGSFPQFSQVSAGGYHTCGVKDDESIVCWGKDLDGQSTPPAGSFQQVSAGLRHTCGVKTDGSIVCWGSDDYGKSTPLAGPFQQVSAGQHHTCGKRPDGSVTCWGDDYHNQALPTAGLCGLFRGDFEEGGDCRWNNGSLPCWSADCDSDGYASREAVGYCSSSSPITAPAECPTGAWTDQPAACGGYDCMDDNADVNSGQASYFVEGYGSAGGLPNRFDYNCDGVEHKGYKIMNTGALCCTYNALAQRCVVLMGPGCEKFAGWDSATVTELPGCGETADYVTCGPGLAPLSCEQKIVERTQTCR